MTVEATKLQWSQQTDTLKPNANSYDLPAACLIVMLGDAAHTMSPILGQGLNCGLEDIQVFANVLQQHQGNVDTALPEYTAARWPDVEAMLNINEIVARSDYTLTTKVMRFLLHRCVQCSRQSPFYIASIQHCKFSFHADVGQACQLRSAMLVNFQLDEMLKSRQAPLATVILNCCCSVQAVSTCKLSQQQSGKHACWDRDILRLDSLAVQQ